MSPHGLHGPGVDPAGPHGDLADHGAGVHLINPRDRKPQGPRGAGWSSWDKPTEAFTRGISLLPGRDTPPINKLGLSNKGSTLPGYEIPSPVK